MADLHPSFAIRRIATLAIGPDGLPGVPIVCPIDCTQIVIENGDTTNDQTVYTDPRDGTTLKTLPAGLELTLRGHSSGDAIFMRGSTVCRVAAATGTGPVIVSFLR